LRCIYNFFLGYEGEMCIITLIEEKGAQHTNTHTLKIQILKMTQHLFDKSTGTNSPRGRSFCVARYVQKYSGYREVPNSNTISAQGLSSLQDWRLEDIKKQRMGKKNG
jgi:hypothetical protein